MEKLAVLGAWAEVYIVAVEREHGKETKPPREEDDYGESSRESLLSLVQPELPTLSQNWLGALRDYAYLSLPTEYSSQLPSDGGTFYHPDTVDNAKPHYKKRWTPILHALAIWLHETGFSVGEMNKESDKNSTVPANAPANMKREEINSDRFYLILGICVEALSNPQTVLTTHAVNGILKALCAVLTSEWPKQQIGVDPILSKEVLNVMHRVFLTQESVYTQLLAVEVVKAVLLAGKDCVQQDRTKIKEKEMEASTSSSESMDISESSSLGDGGEEGDIIPEKSVVYAALEVCLCVISRQIPALNPSAPSTGFQVPTRLTKISDENCSLVASIVLILADLPNLCSKNGSTSILPTILFLITGVLREMSNKGAERKSPVVVQGCLTAFRTLCSSPFLDDEDVGNKWRELLKSALITMLQNAKPSDDKPAIDEVTLLATIAMFLVWGPDEIAQTPAIQTQCVGVFRNCWGVQEPRGPNEVFTDVHISDTKTGQEEGDFIHTRSGCQVSRIFTHIKGR
nr:HEAT repeat-containing protein 5B-like [Crassostrea gigas]